MMMLQDFQTRKEQLLELLGEIHQLAEDRKNEQVAQGIAELKDKLEKNAFYLVVLGQFKRGKSTMVNSLLGTRILPTSVVPLTSIVTVLYYGPEEMVEVIFEDGRRQRIGRDELADFVTEKGNPGNQKGVGRVEIAYPSEYLKGGVHIIDTPGVGSIFENNTQVTYDFLPKVDAALFLFNVDPPISQSELDFLGDVKQYVSKIFFVQNKVDYLDEEERQESMAFSREVIKKALETDSVEIHPLSAKLALEGKLNGDREKLEASYLPELDRVLGDFLNREKGTILLRSVAKSARKLLNDLTFGIELELKAIATPLKDLEDKIKLFEEQLERIQRNKEDNSYFFEAEIKRIMDFLDLELSRLRKDEIPRLLRELRETGESKQHLGVNRYVELMEETLNNGIVRVFDDWIMRQEERLNEEFSRISHQYSDRTNEVIEQLLEASAKLFDIRLEKVKSEEAISSDRRFYYLLGDPPRFFDIAGAVDFFSKKLLPKGLSQSKVLKDLMKKLPERIDANCGRIRSDFMHRIRESFLKFRWDLNSQIDATAQSIRMALDQAMEMKRSSAAETAKREEHLNELVQRAVSLKERLNAFAAELGFQFD